MDNRITELLGSGNQNRVVSQGTSDAGVSIRFGQGPPLIIAGPCGAAYREP